MLGTETKIDDFRHWENKLRGEEKDGDRLNGGSCYLC